MAFSCLRQSGVEVSILHATSLRVHFSLVQITSKLQQCWLDSYNFNLCYLTPSPIAQIGIVQLDKKCNVNTFHTVTNQTEPAHLIEPGQHEMVQSLLNRCMKKLYKLNKAGFLITANPPAFVLESECLWLPAATPRTTPH